MEAVQLVGWLQPFLANLCGFFPCFFGVFSSNNWFIEAKNPDFSVFPITFITNHKPRGYSLQRTHATLTHESWKNSGLKGERDGIFAEGENRSFLSPLLVIPFEFIYLLIFFSCLFCIYIFMVVFCF